MNTNKEYGIGNGNVETQCYPALCFSQGFEDIHIFWSREDARRSIAAEANEKICEITEDGYTPVCKVHTEDILEVYVPGTSIYWEWVVFGEKIR